MTCASRPTAACGSTRWWSTARSTAGPAGLDLGARTPAEIAVSILARIVEVRRRDARPVAVTHAVDPICGMSVVVLPDTPSVEHDGETVYFCREGCKVAFEVQHAVTE